MSPKVIPLRPLARTPASRARATERLRAAIGSAGLTVEQAGALLGVDRRQVHRWLSGEVSLGPLELLVEIEAVARKGRAA